MGKFPMRVFKWSPSFQTSRESSIVPVWFQLPGLPCHLFDKNVLFSIMKSVGAPISVDAATLHLTRPSVARVYVEIDLLRDFPSRIWIEHGDEGDGFWQRLIPENLSLYCSSCFRQGHSKEGCSMNEIRVQQQWQPKVTVKMLSKARPLELKNNQDPPTNIVVQENTAVLKVVGASAAVESGLVEDNLVVPTVDVPPSEPHVLKTPDSATLPVTAPTPHEVSDPLINDWITIFQKVSGNFSPSLFDGQNYCSKENLITDGINVDSAGIHEIVDNTVAVNAITVAGDDIEIDVVSSLGTGVGKDQAPTVGSVDHVEILREDFVADNSEVRVPGEARVEIPEFLAKEHNSGLKIAWQNLVGMPSSVPGNSDTCIVEEMVDSEQVVDGSPTATDTILLKAMRRDNLEEERKRKYGLSDRILRSMLKASNNDPSRSISL